MHHDMTNLAETWRDCPINETYLHGVAGETLTCDSKDHVSYIYLYNEAGAALRSDSENHVSYIYLHSDSDDTQRWFWDCLSCIIVLMCVVDMISESPRSVTPASLYKYV